MGRDTNLPDTPVDRNSAPLSFIESERFPRRMLMASFGIGALSAARYAVERLTGAPLFDFSTPRRLANFAEFDFQNPRDLPGWSAPAGEAPRWFREQGGFRPMGAILYQPSVNALSGEASYILSIDKGAANFLLRADPDLKSFYAIRLARVKNNLAVSGYLVAGKKETQIGKPLIIPNGATRGAHLCTVQFDDTVFSLRVNGTTVFSAQDEQLQGGAIGLHARKQDSFFVFSSRISLG